jgi:uncharacterized protein YwqG
LPAVAAIADDPATPFETGLPSEEDAESSRPVILSQTYLSALSPLADATKTGVVSHRLLGHAQEIQGPMERGFASIIEREQTTHRNPFKPDELMTWPGRRAADYPPEVQRVLLDRSGWRLLLQLDSDNNLGWMWGDAGRLYFWISENALRGRRFEDVWMVCQCY